MRRLLGGAYALALLVAACGGSARATGLTPNATTTSPAADAAAAIVPSAPAPAPRPKVVALDPGHGGDEVGAAAPNGLVEKNSNLDMAFRVRALLEAVGVDVVLTRDSDHRANWQEGVPEPTGYADQRLDLQRRIDIANDAGADVFVSLHSNGSTDTSQNGVEVWWDSSRPFADANQHLATLLLNGVVTSLANVGYEATNRGLQDDVCWRGIDARCFPIFVLGGPRTDSRESIVRRGADPAALGLGADDTTLVKRTANMPAALVENLFISNPRDNAALQSEADRDAIAHGVAQAILDFLSAT